MILFISADLVIKVVHMAYPKRPTNNQTYIICLSLFNIVSLKHESLVFHIDRIINGIKICFFYFYFFTFCLYNLQAARYFHSSLRVVGCTCYGHGNR